MSTSTSPLREKLKEWGNRAEYMGEVVTLDLWFEVHGGRDQAKHAAKRIVMGFSSLRRNERSRIDRQQDLIGQPRLPSSPYADVVCTSVEWATRITVTLAHIKNARFDELYHERMCGPMDAPGHSDLATLQMRAAIARDEHDKYNPLMPNALHASADWVADTDDEADPFAEPGQ